MNISQIAATVPSLTAILRPIVGTAAVIMFGLNYHKKKDAESLGWCLLCVLWTL